MVVEHPEGAFSSFNIDSTMMSLSDHAAVFRQGAACVTSQKPVRWPQSRGTA